MKLVKTCKCRSHVVNLLPAVVFTPLYAVVSFEGWRPVPANELIAVHEAYDIGGFRIALKFLCWHLGWEFHKKIHIYS